MRRDSHCQRYSHQVAILGFLTLVGLVAIGQPVLANDDLGYNRVIQPILRDNCYQCHGPDSGSRKADLRFDKRESPLDLKAIVPGDSASSEMIARILSDDPEEVMPPPDAHHQLTKDEKDILKRWVDAGAGYELHWSFIAPKQVEPPVVADERWSKTPIDRFLRSKMDEMKLTPSGPADRRTLARRVSLDLTGLPPTPEMVSTFVADESPNAYEKLIDQLLASPAWGEHRGRYWLDAARYADTHGIHFDNYREIWSYRDWVINAFNANKPFNQFAIEQLAGDLLPDRQLEQQVATGFNRCNITTNEGGAINEEYIVLYARDRTETTSQVFLGLTMGCAVCHDHKFDPVSQKEFYELSAFFNNTTQGAMDGNVKDTPPTIVVPRLEERDRWVAARKELEAAEGQIVARREAARPEFLTWLQTSDPKVVEATLPTEGLHLHARLDDRDVKTATKPSLEIASAGDFDTDQAFSYGLWVKPGDGNLNGALLARMNEDKQHRGWDLWMDNSRVGTHIIHDWDTNAVRVISKKKLPADVWSHVFVTYDGSSKAAGVSIYYDGKLQEASATNDNLKGSIKTDVPLKLGQRNSSAVINNAQFHDLRLYNRALSVEEVANLAATSRAIELIAKAPESRSKEQVEEIFGWYLTVRDEPTRTLRRAIDELQVETKAIQAQGTVAYVMNEKPEPASAFVLNRGDYDKRRDQVTANTPKILPAMPSDLPKNRLGLAEWLFLPENPLTARVTVNRFWQQMFGNGLVQTTGDFGLTGEIPSNPELLDWLAVEFRSMDWDVKRFFKMLVMTTAYQQSAATTPAAIEKDPSNRYLARGSRYRMDAEMIRDSALFVSDLLVDKIGGPSVRPYQPSGVWEAVAMPESNTSKYKQDTGDKLYRRSMYTLWKRAAPPASMDLLNAPNRETCTVRRELTNTPLQALVTLNDEQFVEAARHLAELVLQPADLSERERLSRLAGRLLNRPLRDPEVAVVENSLHTLLTYYRDHSAEAEKLVAVGETKPNEQLAKPELAGWTMLINELMNLDEVLNK